MNRETEIHYRELPDIHIPRSKFEREEDLITTMSAAKIYPIYTNSDILPGMTVNMKMSAVIRMMTPLYPTFGNASVDIMWFFIPHRLVWNHFKEMWGENTSAWYPQVEYTVPQIYTQGANVFGAKTLADYMGLPVGVENISVSALPFRAYVRVWNDWFRSTPLQQEAPMVTTDNNYVAKQSETYKGGTLLKANKYFDYFTSCLPSPQYGENVLLPLGTWAPVYPTDDEITTISGLGTKSIKFRATGSTYNSWTAGSQYDILGVGNTTGLESGDSNLIGSANTSSSSMGSSTPVYPSNLWTDLSNATAASINQLRQSIAIQHFYEAQARGGGGRYVTFLRNIFGVVSDDARLQRSEYLGGKRIPLQIYTAIQSSSTDNSSPLGQTGAFSHTADSDEYFTKSFLEHGTLLGLAVIRYEHSYEQNVPRMWSRKHWYDFYVPQLANISEQAVLNKEIWASGVEATDNEVFGYQEPWAEYRYGSGNKITGEMRSSYAQTLNSWHYGDNYNTTPTLGSSWIQEDETNIDRTLVVSSGLSDQFMANFYFKPTYVAPMPVYSTPGLTTI